MLRVVAVLLVFIASGLAQSSSGYEQIIKIFQAIQDYRQPLLSKRALDYSPAAVQARHARVQALRRELDAIKPSSWTVSQKIDYLLVRSQLDKLEFGFRVLKPWSR